MRLLDRALRAAVTAKGQLDDVRELRAEASVAPVAAAALSDHERHVVASALTRGAVDPMVLLTLPEASAAAGRPLGGPHLTYGDDLLGVRFEAAGSGGRRWAVSVSAYHAAEDDAPFDAGAHWFGVLRDVVADDGVVVPGLGDEAILRDTDLHVLADPLLLHVEVATPDGPEEDGRRACALARTVLARLLG